MNNKLYIVRMSVPEYGPDFTHTVQLFRHEDDALAFVDEKNTYTDDHCPINWLLLEVDESALLAVCGEPKLVVPNGRYVRKGEMV